jgi:hypothetical protein
MWKPGSFSTISPRSGRSLTIAALVALLAALTVLALPGTTPAAGRPGKPVVLSPRPGQVVRSNVALLRVNSGKGAKVLSARLNGKEIRGQFSRPRRGVRTLKASISFGLRPGRNVLRVRVRRSGGAVHTATVGFQVRRDSGLVGAGRDQVLDADGKVEMQGTTVPTEGAECAGLRWSVARAPRAPRSDAGARRFRLTSPGGLSAGFDPRLPGTYVLRLKGESAGCAATDLVRLKVLYPNRLVPIETMSATGGAGRGIRVGGVTYLLKEAEGSLPEAPGNFGQLLVLNRNTLEFVANRRFNHGIKQTREYLETLKPGVDLAILVLQPDVGGEVLNLESATKLIGAPAGQLPNRPGSISMIGVPGMKPGEAKVNLIKGGNPLASMKGYLTPDRWGNYGFASSTRVPFNFGPKEAVACDDCGTAVGFRLHHLDARTGAPAANNGQIYKTGGPIDQAEAEMTRLTNDLNAIPHDDVVMIETLSTKNPNGSGYLRPVTYMPEHFITALTAAIVKVGGTRNAFNRILLKPGSVASDGMTYALVGWQGAGEGGGAEAAADVEGEGDAPELSGVVRPNNESLLRPEEGDGSPNALTEVVMKEPTTKWPLDNEPAARRAFSWLGEQNEKLGGNPRASYALQPFKQSQWNVIAEEIGKLEFSQVPPEKREFTKKNFLTAREELVTELHWVGDVRAYLEELAKPISGSEVLSYAKVKDISAKVYKEAQEPKDESTMRWLEFTQILLELGGPFTHEVSGTMASAMSLGIWLFGANPEGGEAEEIPFEADELGNKIVEQMDATVKMYERMGDVIVSDPVKLRFVAEHGGCSPGAKGCPPGWSFTKDDETALLSDLQRTVERESWEELLPMGFNVFKTNPQRLENPPDLHWYACGGDIHPFWYFSQTQKNLVTYPLLWEVGTANGHENVWKPLVLAQPKGNHFYATTLADQTAERVFGPVSASTSPVEGGLGVSLARLVPEKNWVWWEPTPIVNPYKDNCD